MAPQSVMYSETEPDEETGLWYKVWHVASDRSLEAEYHGNRCRSWVYRNKGKVERGTGYPSKQVKELSD